MGGWSRRAALAVYKTIHTKLTSEQQELDGHAFLLVGDRTCRSCTGLADSNRQRGRSRALSAR